MLDCVFDFTEQFKIGQKHFFIAYVVLVTKFAKWVHCEKEVKIPQVTWLIVISSV